MCGSGKVRSTDAGELNASGGSDRPSPCEDVAKLIRDLVGLDAEDEYAAS